MRIVFLGQSGFSPGWHFSFSVDSWALFHSLVVVAVFISYFILIFLGGEIHVQTLFTHNKYFQEAQRELLGFSYVLFQVHGAEALLLPLET